MQQQKIEYFFFFKFRALCLSLFIALLCRAGTPADLWLIFPWDNSVSFRHILYLQPHIAAWKKPFKVQGAHQAAPVKNSNANEGARALALSIYRNSSRVERMEGWAGSAPFQDVLSCLLDHERLSRRKGRFV